MAHTELVKLLDNIAGLIIPLFAHRFPLLGSLYFSSSPSLSLSVNGATSVTRTASAQSITSSSAAQTPKASQMRNRSYFQLTPLTPVLPPPALCPPTPVGQEVHVGPIVSWPFFGSNRGDLTSLDRGPWSSTHTYLLSCATREISSVISENEGKSAPHRLHLDPDEVQSSRHHRLRAVPDDQSDDSDEWGLEESEEEEDEGVGWKMYEDYRRMQRGTFLVAHMERKVEKVREDMDRWIRIMEKLGVGGASGEDEGEQEEFGLDLHDLSLENIFVDIEDPSKIVRPFPLPLTSQPDRHHIPADMHN
jgi:hypothetical protein